MFASMDYPWEDEAFAKNAWREAAEVMGSVHSRPSLAVVCGGSEVEQQPAILFATSQDSGLDSGKLLKATLSGVGGRGGGAPRLAQGSAPSVAALEQALTALSASRPD